MLTLLKKIDAFQKLAVLSDPRLAQLSAAPNFAARVRLADTMFSKIRAGSGRIAYHYNDQLVLKLAKNEKGIQQNRTEADGFMQQNYKDLITAVVDSDPDDKWNVVEKAVKAKEADFQAAFGTTRSNLCSYLHSKRQSGSPHLKVENAEMLDNNQRVQELLDMLGNFTMPVNDICRLSSWGKIGNRLILVDYGLTDDILREYYLMR